VTFASLAARNVLRNKVRTVLTIMGVAVAIVTFLLLRTVLSSWTAAADFAAKDRVVTRHKITFVMPLPKRYIDQVRQTPGVKTATYANWFGGRNPNKEDQFFGTFAVDPDTYFVVYDDIAVPEGDLKAFKEDKRGVILGDVLAKSMEWKVGDEITLESGIYAPPADSQWTFTVRGIYTAKSRAVDRSSLLLHWDYMNDSLPEGRRDAIGWVVSRVTDPSQSAGMGVTLDKLFDDQDVQTLSQDEHSFNASFLAGFSAVLKAINFVTLAILLIMTLIMANTIAMGVRERTSEYGTMRAIGFMPKHIVFFVVIEAAVLGLLGGIVGVAIGYPFVERGLGRYLEENMGTLFPFFRVPPLMMVAALGLSVMLGLLASVIPAYLATRIRVTDALRRVV